MTIAGELRWAVKDSFLRYVRVIAAGTVVLSDGAEETVEGSFSWPLQDARREGAHVVLDFSGSVHFTAHGGFLDVDLREPSLRLGAVGNELSVRLPDSDERVVIATIEANAGGGDALIPALTDAGVEMFGNVYGLGTAMAPLSASVPRDPSTPWGSAQLDSYA